MEPLRNPGPASPPYPDCANDPRIRAPVGSIRTTGYWPTMSAPHVRPRLQRRDHRLRDISGAVAAAEFHRLDAIGIDLVDRALDAFAGFGGALDAVLVGEPVASVKRNLSSVDASLLRSTSSAGAITSGPMPSPPSTAIWRALLADMGVSLTSEGEFVIPGRCEASNPESRDSGSGANAPSRNDDLCC